MCPIKLSLEGRVFPIADPDREGAGRLAGCSQLGRQAADLAPVAGWANSTLLRSDVHN